ncbi:MAG: TrbI/VirB10 family protein [Rhodanobacteraceae bacterium]|nr:MAG: TrbI/VirB10 family protein [Rhodanobacteraceae bacterium]
MSQGSTPKPPINRKMALYIVAGVGVVILVALLAALMHENPAAKQAQAQAAAKQEAVAKLQAGSESAAKQVIDQNAPQPQFSTSSLYNQPITGQNSPEKPASASTNGLPPLNPATLSQLDAAFKASQKPTSGDAFANAGEPGHSPLELGPNRLVSNHDGSYEDYPKSTSSMAGHGAQEATGVEPVSAATSEGTYPAVKPMRAPADRILEQGTLIRAVLDTKVDTRNAGNVIATVTQDVYDSINQSQLLVPKGTRLIGSYSQAVAAGSHAISVVFRRMELPDGRAVDIGPTQSTDYSGASGIQGKYHSNILRALGPSLVVALIGTAVDRWGNKGQQRNQQSPFGMQSPSVAEQMAPQVNQEVMSRYGTAQPYFIIEAGTPFKLLTQKDIVIPPPERAARAGNEPVNTTEPQAGVWENGSPQS